jgi:hypothetical protein
LPRSVSGRLRQIGVRRRNDPVARRHDESRSQNHSFVVLTPRTIMTIMAKAMIKSAH